MRSATAMFIIIVLALFGCEKSDGIPVVTSPDSLDERRQELLNVSENRELTIEVFDTVTYITVYGFGYDNYPSEGSDFGQVQYFTNTAFIDGLESIHHFSDLRLFPNLESLELGYQNISVIPDLSFLEQLKELDLRSNPLTDWIEITELPSLTGVGLADTGVVDLSAFSNAAFIDSLEYLDLSYTAVEDISPLIDYKSLTYLKLLGTRVNISDIAVFTSRGIKVDISNSN